MGVLYLTIVLYIMIGRTDRGMARVLMYLGFLLCRNNVGKMNTKNKQIIWNKKTSKAALMIAQGHTIKEVAEALNLSDRTIERFKEIEEFSEEVTRLSYMVGVANRAYRLQLINKVIKQKTSDNGTLNTEKDLLEWMKLAQSETDGAKIDLTKLFEADDE